MNLSTGGRKTRITLDKIEKQIFFDEENLYNFRVKGASKNKMKKITNYLRSNVGKMSVLRNYREHMSEQSSLLKSVYKTGIYEFDCEGATDKQYRPVVYANAEELLDEVIAKRNLVGNIVIKVMADGGQSFFKISLTIMPGNYLPKTIDEDPLQQDFEDENMLETTDDNDEFNKRKLSSEGGSLSKKSKLSSVNKLILLCVVPAIKETHANIELLFDLTQMNNIPFKFVSDFKLLLIVNGQQTATSTFPCPYYFISLNDLRGKKSTNTGLNDSATSSSFNNDIDMEDHTKSKTFGDLRRNYEKYCSMGKDKKLSKECYSTINPPLFNEDDDIPVLQKCVVPELHVLQGFVNHLFWRGLVPMLGPEKALMWPMKLN